MLEFSEIDADLSVYRKHRVILWGCGREGYRQKKIFDTFGIRIEAFVDNDSKKWGSVFLETRVISFDELVEKAHDDHSWLVQISCGSGGEIAGKLQQIGIKYISLEEFIMRVDALLRYQMIQKRPELKKTFCDLERENLRGIGDVEVKSLLPLNDAEDAGTLNIIFATDKVGNTTLAESCFHSVLELSHVLYIHKHEKFWNYIKQKNLNIACGVRDVLSQILSSCFQVMGYYYDIDEFWHGGGDVQKIFDDYVIAKSLKDKDCVYSVFREYREHDLSLPEFFERQMKKYFEIDVYQYPFDTEKGFSVIRKGNVNLMIYQLEKMDTLEKQFAEFFGFGDEFALKRANNASDKWYETAYRRAKKEIRFDERYFLECYEGKYMRHFYSKDDIEKFKCKWMGNIRNEMWRNDHNAYKLWPYAPDVAISQYIDTEL